MLGLDTSDAVGVGLTLATAVAVEARFGGGVVRCGATPVELF